MPQILSPATIEHCCRFILATNTRQGLLPVRIALAASAMHGNDWFRVGDVLQSLNAAGGSASMTGDLAQRMVNMDIAESLPQATGPGRHTYGARITSNLVDQSHFHGQKSLRLRHQIETYYGLKPDASPVAALLLIGLHVFQIHESIQLGRFLLPQFRFGSNLSLPGRTLRQLAQAGLLGIVRNRPGPSRPFLVYPL